MVSQIAELEYLRELTQLSAVYLQAVDGTSKNPGTVR
jgi:hypothetical protein